MKALKLIPVLSLLLIQFVYGQSGKNAILEGRIFNEKNNEPVEFANVVIYNTSTGTVTDLEGNFLFTGLKPGFVQIAVSSIGYETYITKEILVTNAKRTYIEIGLTEQAIQLEEVVVKSSQFRVSEESPVSLRRIGISEIEKNPGGNRDISRVIQSLPGVSSSPNFRNDVIVRGGGSSENRFYLDGVEIPNLNHFATQGASGGPVGIINVDFIREVNLYSGAFPANRGNALSSVLEMNQIDGNKEKLKFRGSVGASDLALTIDGPLGEKTNYIASFRRSYLQFLFSAIGLPFLPTYNDFQFRVRSRLNEKNEIIVLGLGALDLFDLNTDANETADQRYILSFIPVNEQWSYTLGTVFKHYTENGYHSFVLSRNHLNNIAYKHENNDESLPLTLDYSSQEIENKFRYENTLRLNKNKFNYGVKLEKGTYYNSTYRLNFFNNQVQEIDYDADITIVSYGIFGQYSRKLLNGRLQTSGGIRLDANNYSAEMENPLKQISPRVSLSYALIPEFSVNFNTGRYYQRPPYTTLGYSNNQGEYLNRLNNIKYISADHIVGGLRYQPSQNEIVTLEGFFKYYRDYPYSIADSVPISSKGGDFGTFGDEEVLSISEGRAYGIELLARSLDLLGFNTVLSYTLVRSEFKNHANDLSLTNKYIPTAWDNRHILNLTATTSFNNNWDVGFKWRYVDGAPYTPVDVEKSRIIEAWNARGAPYLNYNRFNQERLAAFHQLDIRVDKSFFFNKWSLIIYLDVQNVYNFKADEPDRYALPSIINNTPPQDNIVLNDNNMPVYDLQRIVSEGSGTVLPTIGLIIEL